MSIAEELEKLQALRDKGTISDAEFARAKQQVLDGSSARSGTHSALLHRLMRSRSDRLVAGVCGGLGQSTDLPSWAWRTIFCLTLLYFGTGLFIYILLWIFLPEEHVS
jgi:phage shock protein C